MVLEALSKRLALKMPGTFNLAPFLSLSQMEWLVITACKLQLPFIVLPACNHDAYNTVSGGEGS